ncbi:MULTISPECIES: LLM class flavin-dependent oxidoreductase [Streptomyces]
MTIEFIGIAATQETSESGAGTPAAGQDGVGVRREGICAQSESARAQGPVVQPGYLRDLARAHEASGFDRVLVAHSSASPDGFTVADQILTHTDRLGVLLAHRPGFVAPTLAARKFATLDAFHPGRVALHVITGGDDADQARDGDFTDKPTRYRRTDDFLQVVRKAWTSSRPFDHDGDFYQVTGGLSAVRPQTPIPVYFGGASADAVRVGARHADVYAFWGEPLDGIAERIGEVRAAARPHGRDPRFSVSLRPIPAATETEAWDRAREILRLTKERAGEARKAFNLDHRAQRGSQRLLEYAAQGEVHDKRLWTAIAKTTGAAGNSTALVGSYEQVAESLLDYVSLGVTTLLIRGFSPLADARDYGTLVRLVRDQAERVSPVASKDPVVPA